MSKNEVAKKEENAVADPSVLGFLDQTEDSFGQEDLSIPFVKILQKISPECDEDTAKFVDGANPGHIFNTASKSAKDKIIFIPVKYGREYTEWKPRKAGGGLVAHHGSDASVLGSTKKDDDNNNVTSDGNHIVEAGVYYGLVFDESNGSYEHVVISMTSSQFKPARDWNYMIKNQVFKTTDAKGNEIVKKGPPMFFFSYVLETVKQTKDQDTWYNWKISTFAQTTDLPNGNSLVKDAADFKKSIQDGVAKAAYETNDGSDDLDDDIPM